MFGPFLYPPPSLLGFIVFPLFPYQMAEKIFTVLSLLSYFLSIILLFRICNIVIVSFSGTLLLIAASLFFPAKFTLGMGQFNLIILLFIVSSLFFMVKQKEIPAGSFYALALSGKLFPLLLLPYFFFKKRWRLLISTSVTLFILGGLSFIIFGKEIYGYFLSSLSHFATQKSGVYYNQSLSGFIARTLPDSDLSYALQLILLLGILLILLVTLFLRRKNKKQQQLLFSFCVTANLLVNAVTWQHHLVWSIIPLILTFAYLRAVPFPRRVYLYSILAVCYLLICLNIKNPEAFPIILRSHAFYGVTLLYSLQCYLLMKDPASKK